MRPALLVAVGLAAAGGVAIGVLGPDERLEAALGGRDPARIVILATALVAMAAATPFGAWAARTGASSAAVASAWFLAAAAGCEALGATVLPSRGDDGYAAALWADGGLVGAALGAWAGGLGRPAAPVSYGARLALAATAMHAAFWLAALPAVTVLGVVAHVDDSVAMPALVVLFTASGVGSALAAVVPIGPVERGRQRVAALAAAGGLALALPDKEWLVRHLLEADPVAVAVSALPLLLLGVVLVAVEARARRALLP
jgi:hypothetical protein